MAGKSFSVSFNIHGSLDGSLQAALKAAANAMRGLGNAAKTASAAAAMSKSGLAGMANSLNQLSTAAQRYKQLQDALKQSSAGFAQSGRALEAAKAKYEADAAAVDKLKQKLQELRQAQIQASTAKSSKNAALKQMRQDLAALKRAYAEAKKAGDQLKMSTLGAQIKSTQGAISTQQAQIKAAAQAYKELSEQVKKTKADLQAANAAAQKSGQDLSAQRTNAQRLSQSFQSQLAALNQLKAQLSSAGFNLSSFGASESRLAAEIDRVNAALQRQQQLTQAQQRSAQASQDMFNAYNNFQGALDTASTMAQPFKSATENAMEFEYAMSKVKSLTQMRDIRAGNIEKVDTAMQGLTQTAEQLGARTEFTSTQIAEAMGYLGMAGWDDKKIQGAISPLIDLATIAGDQNIPRTADVLSDDMTALGIKAGEAYTLASGKIVDGAEYFSDAFAYAITQANLNREQLHEALKYNAAPGHTAGMSLGEIFAQNMVVANAGIKGSMAGTSFRAGWTRFLAPPKTAMKSLQEMGMTASDATKEIMEAQAALQEAGASIDDNLFTKITKAYDYYQTLDKNQRAGWLKNLVGQNALTGWQVAFDSGNFKDILKFAEEIDSGAIEGWAADTAAVMRDNTKTSVELLNSSIDALQRNIGNALTPTVRAAADAFAPIVTAAAEFIQANPQIVQAAAGIAAALATIVVGAAAVKLAFAGWTFITSSITMVQAALATLADGALLGGLVARLTALRTALFGLGGAATLGGWSAMFAAISTKAAAAATAIRAFFASLTLGSMASGIATTISSIGTAIAGAARAAMSFAFSPVGVALMALALAGAYVYQNWEKVGPLFSNIAGIITGALGNAIATIQPAIQSIMSAFEALGTSGVIQALVDNIGGGLVAAIASVATIIASALATVINVIANIATAVTGIISGIVSAVAGVLSGDWTAAWEGAKSAAEAALNGIKGVAESILNGITTAVESIGKAWSTIFGDSPQAPDLPTAQAPAATTQAVQEAAPVVQAAPEAPQIDTSATQAALDQVGDAAANAASNMDGVNQASQMLSQAGDGAQALAQNIQQAGTGVDAFSQNTQQAGSMVQAFGQQSQQAQSGVQALGNSSQQATGGIDALAAAAQGACGGTEALGSAANSAAGAVSGLGAAAQAACQQLAQAGAQAAAAVTAAAASAGKPAANYKGGIYKKGAFLTTFAEKSPEAAIPLDGSKRAQDLWRRAGEILGLLPSMGTPTFDPKITTPPFNPDIPLPKGDEITYTGSRQLPSRDDLRRQKMPEFYSRFPKAPTQRQRPTSPTLRPIPPVIPKPTTFPQMKIPSTPPFIGEKISETSTLEKIATTVTPIITKVFPKVGGVIERITEQIFSPQIQEPTLPLEKISTPPTFRPEPKTTPPLIYKNLLAGDSELGRLHENFLQTNSMTNQNSAPSTFNVTINVNVTGNADEATIKRGVEQAIPSLDDWARKHAAFLHDAARRSFA